MHDLARRDQICNDLGRLFGKLDKTRSIRSKKAITARGKLLDKIGRNLDTLRRLDIFVTMAPTEMLHRPY